MSQTAFLVVGLLTMATLINASINTQLTFGPSAGWRARGPLTASSMRLGHSEPEKPRYRQRTLWTPNIWGINMGKRTAEDNLAGSESGVSEGDLGSMYQTLSEAHRRNDIVRMFNLVSLINSAGATAAE